MVFKPSRRSLRRLEQQGQEGSDSRGRRRTGAPCAQLHRELVEQDEGPAYHRTAPAVSRCRPASGARPARLTRQTRNRETAGLLRRLVRDSRTMSLSSALGTGTRTARASRAATPRSPEAPARPPGHQLIERGRAPSAGPAPARRAIATSWRWRTVGEWRVRQVQRSDGKGPHLSPPGHCLEREWALTLRQHGRLNKSVDL